LRSVCGDLMNLCDRLIFDFHIERLFCISHKAHRVIHMEEFDTVLSIENKLHNELLCTIIRECKSVNGFRKLQQGQNALLQR